MRNRKLNILWVAPYPYNSNQHPAPWIVALANLLTESGVIELTILSPTNNLKIGQIEQRIGNYTIIYLGIPKAKRDLITFYLERINIIKNWLNIHAANYDVLHIHGTEHQYEIAARNLNIPVVISLQGILSKCVQVLPEIISLRKVFWMLGSHYEKIGIKSHINFIGRTKWDKECIFKIQPSANYYKVWEVLRPEFYSNNKTFNYKQGHNSFQLLFIGGTNDLKGYKEVINTLIMLLEDDNRWQLIIAGSVNENKIKRVINSFKMKLSHRLINRIVLLGKLDAKSIINTMQSSFVLLHPSYIDNSPNSICEAQYLGLPTIATNVGGVNELIENNLTGLFCALQPISIKSKILFLKQNPKIYQLISENSSKLAQRRHCKESIVLEQLKAYKMIIQN